MRKLLSTFRINRFIMLLTASDVSTWSFYYVINGLVGIYIANKIGANAVEIVGIGLSVYTLTRSILQIPIGLLTDKIKSDKDEIITLIIGNVLMGFPFLFLPFVRESSTYYLIQFVFGIGTAINLVSWRKLFAMNLDKNREGIDYAVYDTITSAATALFGAVAGLIANINDFYFDLVIFVIAIFMTNSWIWGVLILINRNKKHANKDGDRPSEDLKVPDDI